MSEGLELPEEVRELLSGKTKVAIELADKRGVKGGDVKLFCLIFAYFDEFTDRTIENCRVAGIPDYSGNARVDYDVSIAGHNESVADLSAELLWKLKELMTI
jgi:hypothetical protein